MNKNSTFGIGLSLATMLVFTAPAMAEPITVYFEPKKKLKRPLSSTKRLYKIR